MNVRAVRRRGGVAGISEDRGGKNQSGEPVRRRSSRGHSWGEKRERGRPREGIWRGRILGGEKQWPKKRSIQVTGQTGEGEANPTGEGRSTAFPAAESA